MGNGDSRSTTVCVRNNFGAKLDRVTVYHKFRADGNSEEYTWRDVHNGKLTSASMTVRYRTGFGAWTDYDWWKVIFYHDGIKYSSDGVWEGGGFKQCFLKEEDQRGPVTIIIESSRSDGVVIMPYSSGSASTNWTRGSGGGGLRGVTRSVGTAVRQTIVNPTTDSYGLAPLAGVGVGLLAGPVAGAVYGGVQMGGKILDQNLVPSGYGQHLLSELDDIDEGEILDCCTVLSTDFLFAGSGGTAAVGRVILFPTSQATSSTFRVRHEWIVFQLERGGYISCALCAGGDIVAYKCETWDEARTRNGNVRVIKLTHEKTSRGRKSVTSLKKKLRSTDAFYQLNTNNCTDFARDLFNWFSR